jgi:hypothetical protein
MLLENPLLVLPSRFVTQQLEPLRSPLARYYGYCRDFPFRTWAFALSGTKAIGSWLDIAEILPKHLLDSRLAYEDLMVQMLQRRPGSVHGDWRHLGV